MRRGWRAGSGRPWTRRVRPAVRSGSCAAVDLDTTGIDAALGAKGANDGGIYNFGFARREIVVDHDHGDRHRGAGRVPPPGMGVTTAIGFQPVGPDGMRGRRSTATS